MRRRLIALSAAIALSAGLVVAGMMIDAPHSRTNSVVPNARASYGANAEGEHIPIDQSVVAQGVPAQWMGATPIRNQATQHLIDAPQGAPALPDQTITSPVAQSVSNSAATAPASLRSGYEPTGED
jgi:hypothetical protein